MARGVHIKDHWSEQRLFDQRAIVGGAIIVLLTFGLLGRLFLLQVIRHDYYAELSQGNRVRTEPIPAARGLILDRHGVVVAGSQPAYQLELVPEEVPNLQAALNGLVQLDLIRAEDVDELKKTIRSRRAFDSVPVRLRMSDEDVAKFAVRRFEFQGLDIKTRQTRSYPNGDLAVHALGYVGAISEADLARIDRAAYSGTALIGKQGVESAYEAKLHGFNGSREILVNAQGRSVEKQGAFTPDLHTHAPTAGEDIVLAMDLKVQRTAEEAFAGRRGALVAIDPNNGDVLAMTSRPGFDPNLFGRGITRSEYATLKDDIDTPLLDRTMRGVYPPGSTVKPVLALAGLAYHMVDPDQPRFCAGQFRLPGSSHLYRESIKYGRHGNVNLVEAIAKSCDVYFYSLADIIGVDRIAAFLAPFGFGQATGVDIGGELKGILPSREWKASYFKRPADKMWFPGETVNFGIGQGYLNVTPLQMAHYASVLASRGKVWKPRLVTGFRDSLTGKLQALSPVREPDITLATPEQWDRVHAGMIGAVTHGTAAHAVGQNLAYPVAGKTGTAQVFSVGQNERYNEKTVAERLRDHAWFIAFAPADKPRIALAVIVENGGWGSTAAGPIARKVLDAYLLGDDGKLKPQEAIGTSILPATKPVDGPAAPPPAEPPAPIPDQKRATSPADSANRAS
jgi:penicillin-binding protein 2